MKAAIWTAYGPPEVLKSGELPKPVPLVNEVLIKTVAATVTAGDCELRRFDIANWIWLPVRLFMGIFKPRIKVLGQEFSGRVEAVGEKVSKFKTGDRVLATAMKMGGYAEYVCIKESGAISLIPDTISFEQAATIPTGGINALHFVRTSKVSTDDQVLIIGAGGSIGTYAIQLCKLRGANVTAMDSGDKLSMLSDIGADHTINYLKTNLRDLHEDYDVIIDIVGSAYGLCMDLLRPAGRLMIGNPTLTSMIKAIWSPKKTGQKAFFSLADYTQEGFDAILQLLVDEEIEVVMDRSYALDDIVTAHQYVEAGEKKGNVIVKIE